MNAVAGKTCVSVAMMVTPALMVPAAAAPTIMMAAAAVVHMTVAVAMSASDPNDGIILRDQRCHPQPRGSGCGQCKRRCEQRGNNENETFHAVSSHRMIAI